MRRWAPLAATISVVAVAVAVSFVLGRSGGGQPPVLQLAASHGSRASAATNAPLLSSTQAVSSSSYQLVGSLPSGPTQARAYPLARGAANPADVRRLAAALGITDEPRRVANAWQAGPLRVEDAAGNPWAMYAGCGPAQPVSSDAMTSICSIGTGGAVPGSVSGGGAVSGGPSTPNSTSVALPPPAPSPLPTADVDQARRVAGRVLAELDLGDADVSVQGGGQAFVQATPRVRGLRTSGYDTTLQIDVEGHVVGGNGFLGRPTDGAVYPLVSAKTAYDALPELPRPMMLCPATANCPLPAPVRITGAVLGLQLTALNDDQAVLLPAWLFTVDGWPAPLAHPAIEPRFLQRPTPMPIDPGAVKGAVPPAPGIDVPPGGPVTVDRACAQPRAMPSPPASCKR